MLAACMRVKSMQDDHGKTYGASGASAWLSRLPVLTTSRRDHSDMNGARPANDVQAQTEHKSARAARGVPRRAAAARGAQTRRRLASALCTAAAAGAPGHGSLRTRNAATGVGTCRRDWGADAVGLGAWGPARATSAGSSSKRRPRRGAAPPPLHRNSPPPTYAPCTFDFHYNHIDLKVRFSCF